MVFRRSGRPSFYFQAQTATGYKQLSTDTKNRTVANKIVAMWDALADAREWDVLGRVVAGELTIGTLYDRWQASKQDTKALRRHLEDVELGAVRADFLAVYARGVKPDSVQHVRVHLNALPSPLLRSQVTTERLTAALYAYAGRRNTLRKVHSSWSVFFAYLTDVRGLFESNPMDKVERPDAEKSPIKFYELDAVRRIVDHQPTAERRVFMALQYGVALDVSTSLGLTRSDVWDATKEIRAAGTKTHTRDRVCRVADWAWPLIEKHIAAMLPGSPLFPRTWNRWTVSDWHRETVEALNLPAYPLRNARDHWAVRAARAGTPIAVIQHQLGHGSPMQTLTKYGRFLPSASDRDRWEQEATKTDRRSAKDGAKMKRANVSNSRGGT